VEECRPCPVFAGFNLVFALQLRKSNEKHVRLIKTSVSVGSMSAASRLLGFRGSNPSGGMDVYLENVVWCWGRLYDGMITRPGVSYQMRVSVRVNRCNNNPLHSQ
jgi:hypothetical protein